MKCVTGQMVEGDVYSFLKGSTLDRMLSGDVYRGGCRPRDSAKEDVVVTFTSGLSEEVQTGVVTVNVFVPDIAPWGNGVFVPDSARLAKIEAAAQAWFESLKYGDTPYLFSLSDTIHTQNEPELKQHFVVVRLAYRRYAGDWK